MNSRANTGALAVGMFFLILMATAIPYIMLKPTLDDVHSEALNQTDNSTAEKGINQTQQLADHYPLLVALISVFGLIVLAFFERRRGF